MYSTKHQVDKYVRSILSNSLNKSEKNLYGYQFAKLYVDVRDYQAARKYINEFIAVRQNYPPAFQLLGQILEAMSSVSEAVEAYQKAYELDPSNKQLVLKICDLVSRHNVPLSNSNVSIYSSSNWSILSKNIDSATNPSEVLQSRISLLKNLLSRGDFHEAFDLCITTINEFVCIDRTAWHNAVLDFIFRVPTSCHNCSWYKQVGSLQGFALVEILRLTANTDCLSDFLSKLAQVDEYIVGLLSSSSRDDNLAVEIQLRFFFYLSVYFRRLAKKRGTRANLGILIDACLNCTTSLKTTTPLVDRLFSKPVWNHLFSEGLSLRLQSAVLAKPSENNPVVWKSLLFEALDQDNLSKNKQFKFEFLHSLEESVGTGNIHLHDVEELYSKLLEYKSDNISIILWYILRPLKTEEENASDDLALPLARLQTIVDSINRILPMTPLSTEGKELCQLDGIVFLVALSVAYLIRYASLESPTGRSQASSLSWPSQPLCLFNTRSLPTGVHRRFWSDFCTRNKNDCAESDLTHFVDQLRFIKPAMMPARLILRVARAISRLPLESSAADIALARAAHIWEAGLCALMRNPKAEEKYSCGNVLFPTDLNSDWWYGAQMENLINVASKDRLWFFIGWRWLTSYWLEHPPLKLETLINHLRYLEDQRLPVDTECVLLAAKLVEKAMGLDTTSSTTKSLGNLALRLLNTASESVQRSPIVDESSTVIIKDISDAITSLQKVLGVSGASVKDLTQASVNLSTNLEQNITMPSGYGAYATGPRTPSFSRTTTSDSRVSGILSESTLAGAYRSPRIPSVPNTAYASPTPDLQTKLMTQMIEQWMPSFMEFSRVMSDTSAELAKSRLQNEELSRLLKETRSQLDTVIKERQNKNRSPSPLRHPSPPSQFMPSPEEWRALQESLCEVTSTLKEFRQWLSTVMSYPPPFSHPMHIPPPPPASTRPSAILRPGDIFALENQQKAQLALSQLAVLQQQQHQTPQTTGAPCFLLQPHPQSTIPPQAPLDFRVPPTGTYIFPPGMSAGPVTSASISADPPEAALTTAMTTAFTQPLTSVKPPTPPAAPMGASVVTQANNTPVVTQAPSASPPASKPFPFMFKSTDATTTAADRSKTETSSIFSFVKFKSPETVGTSTLFGSSSFSSDRKLDVKTQPSHGSDISKGDEGTTQENLEDEEDKPEAFEPKVEFTPCVQKLPDLVEQSTGEETERVLFCHRARLFRWDKSESVPTGEWKARGIGELKVLADDAAAKFRIVMRREQVMKLCANHYILPGINLKRHPQKSVACMWNAKDFAVMDIDKQNPNGHDELFMVHFKTEEITDEFERTVRSCLEKACSLTPKSESENSSTEEKSKPISTASTLEKLKSTVGSWTCCTCALVVDPDADKCPACQTVKPGTSTNVLDKLRPKAGSWTCTVCALVVAPDLDKCPACQTFKPGAKPPPTTASSVPPTFNFLSTNTSTSSKIVSTNLFLGDSGGAPSVPTTTFPKFVFGGSDATKAEAEKSFCFSSPNTSETKVVGATTCVFGNLDFNKSLETPNIAFTFKMKPPTPIKSKNSDDFKELEEGKDTTAEYDDNEDSQVSPSDLSQVSFKPVVEQLPEKVEVRTGEEDEEAVFEARAKLFRFDNGVWKERGLGQLKLLRSPASGRVRMVMRREQVHKVCCNHPITAGMTLKPMEFSKNPVTPWVWWAVDFSDEESGSVGKKEMFSVRFKTSEESQAFYDAFMKAAGSNSEGEIPTDLDADESELVIVESPLSSEQIARARALQLPDDFYAYELKKPESSNRRSQREEMTPEEEAEEEALLEEAVNRGTSSSSSSIVVVKSTESLVITTPPTSPTLTASMTDALRACQNPKPEKKISAAKQLGSDGVKPFSGAFLGGGGENKSFETLSKEASTKPSWLTASKSQSSTPSWPGAGSALFSKADNEENGGSVAESDPDPQFEPIIPLPSLVETKTGEEEEVCLFLRRCKLYRMLDQQWKERGIGDMKILVHPKTPPPADFLDPRTELPADKDLECGINYARLLMRRDQVLKICTNHTISADLPQFKPLTVANHGICWVAKDYSDDPAGEVMTLGLKFKTEQDLAHFHASIARAREMLKKN